MRFRKTFVDSVRLRARRVVGGATQLPVDPGRAQISKNMIGQLSVEIKSMSLRLNPALPEGGAITSLRLNFAMPEAMAITSMSFKLARQIACWREEVGRTHCISRLRAGRCSVTCHQGCISQFVPHREHVRLFGGRFGPLGSTLERI